MSKGVPHHGRDHRKGTKDEREQIASELAPLEEQDQKAAQKQLGKISVGDANQQNGAIVVDNADLHVPEGVMEDSSNKKGFLGIEPVVLVILGAMLLYIAFIAWQIAHMPPPEALK